ncbi:MAG TPA: ABC transporter substrate-binding protein [Acidobacteriota bacterium]|nr:ABC transporter substrate-binding protein [Acidobacteriota bacterium]
MINIRLARLVALICFTLTLLLLPARLHAQKFVQAFSSISALNAPFWIIQDAGFAKQEGLTTELVYIPSSSTVAQATLSGEVMISPANGQVIADVGLQGGDLVAMGGITNVVAFYIMATPEIKSVADLKGKPMGVTRFGSSGDVGVRMFLTKYGLEPVKDVPLIQLGGLPEIAAAMTKRTIVASAFSQPMAYVAQQGGAHLLANLAKENIPFLHVGITTTRKFMRERRSQAKAYLRAYARAVHFMHTKKEDTKAIFTKYTKIKDQGMLDGSLTYGYDFIEKVPLVKPSAFQVTLDDIAKKNPKAKSAKPEQFYDNSLVQELVDEGFFVKLWGRAP